MTPERPHHRLRLSPEDVPQLWGIITGHLDKQDVRWPCLERIQFDLEVWMRELERADVG